MLHLVLHRLVHEDQAILVAVQRLECFFMRLVYIGTRKADETREPVGSSDGSVREVDNGNGGSDLAGPPSGGLVRSIRKNIVLPVVEVCRTGTGKNG